MSTAARTVLPTRGGRPRTLSTSPSAAGAIGSARPAAEQPQDGPGRARAVRAHRPPGEELPHGSIGASGQVARQHRVAGARDDQQRGMRLARGQGAGGLGRRAQVGRARSGSASARPAAAPTGVERRPARRRPQGADPKQRARRCAVARSKGANAESGICCAALKMSLQRLAGAEAGLHGNPWSAQLVATNVPTSNSRGDSVRLAAEHQMDQAQQRLRDRRSGPTGPPPGSSRARRGRSPTPPAGRAALRGPSAAPVAGRRLRRRSPPAAPAPASPPASAGPPPGRR